MAERIVVGSVVNEVGFEFDRNSLNTLNKFQQRISQLKKQMGGLTARIDVQARAQIKAQNDINKSLQKGTEYAKKYEKAVHSAKLANSPRGANTINKLLGIDNKTNSITAKDTPRIDLINRKLYEKSWSNNIKSREDAEKELARVQKEAAKAVGKASAQNNIKNIDSAKEEAKIRENAIKTAARQWKQFSRMKSAVDKVEADKQTASIKQAGAQWKAFQKTQAAMQQKADAEKAKAASMEDWRAQASVKDAFNQARRMSVRRDTIAVGAARFNETAANAGINETQYARLSNMLTRVSERFERGEISAKRYNYELGRVNRITRQLGNQSKTLKERLDGLYNKLLLGGAAYGVYELGKSIAHTSMDLEGYHAGLIATTGSAKTAADTLQWLKGMANGLGVDMQSATKEFMSFSAAAGSIMNQNQMRKVFEGYTQYAKAIDLSNERYQLGLLALTQMASKGVIQSQEARQQLGENVAGGYQLIQKAAGQTGKQFEATMRSGGLLAKDILPKLGEEFRKAANNGHGLDMALKNTRSEFARMRNAITGIDGLNDTIFKSGFGKALSGFARTATYLIQVLTPLGGLLGGFLKTSFMVILLPIRLITSAVLDLADMFGIKLNGDVLKVAGSILGLIVGVMGLVKAFKLLRAAEIALMELGFVKSIGKMIAGSKLLGWLSKVIGKVGLLRGALAAGGAAATGAEVAGTVAAVGEGAAAVGGAAMAGEAAAVGGTALAGAAAGAEAGTLITPLVGTIIGAIIGALGVGAWEYFGSDSAQSRKNTNNATVKYSDSVIGMNPHATRPDLSPMETASKVGGEIKHTIDINVHDGQVKGLIDAHIKEHKANDEAATSVYRN